MERFDAVVIGSGFGGSVMAYRLAAAGKSVCLLERGKTYPPGSFVRTPSELRNNFWDPSEGRYGLFNVWSFRGMAALISAGLGGGSLIYANVLVRKDERWFADPILENGGIWPVSRVELDPHYDAVQRILRPSTFPSSYQYDNKTAAMREAARELEIAVTDGNGDPANPQWYLPHLAITFNVPGEAPLPGRIFDAGQNYHGALRETCRLCGECDIGCNYGSKNTLDFTYITLAKEARAEIRPLTEVKSFVPLDSGGYRITCARHYPEQATRAGAPPLNAYEVEAKNLILSAGTLGTTYLLLKMKASNNLAGLSRRLGSRFSGNGDLLMFATRCTDASGRPVHLGASRAPVITSTFRFPDSVDTPNAGRGFYLQDAGYPLVLDYVWELLDRRALPRLLRFLWRSLKATILDDPRTEIDARLEQLVGDGNLSNTSMPLLGMGRDVPDGQMSVAADRHSGVPLLQLSWNDRRSRGYMNGAYANARRVTKALGGRYIVNPLTRWLNDVITVHPLGGCPMGGNADEGVVDACGRVFNYPGLYVADGSIMPGPVGPNPSFTIAALSDRIADAVLEDNK